MKILPLIPLLAVTAVVLGACSTTKRLGEHDVLYTGVRKINITSAGEEKVPSGVKSAIKEAVNVKPNNPMPLLSPYMRTPFPIGLWVYNNWNDSARGLKGWLYKKLVAQPVLISNVRPNARVLMIEETLDRNGYFGSTATYDLNYSKKNRKKASITYNVSLPRPYKIDSVIYINNRENALAAFIDSLARKSDYLTSTPTFCVDSLEDLRIKITNRLRNKGYYYFRPDFIEFLADSLINPGNIALKLKLADNVPPSLLKEYRTGNITTTVNRFGRRSRGAPDTLQTARGELIVMRPAHLRENLVPSCITFRKGKTFSVRDMDRTQTRLARLGIFSNIEITAEPADTSAGNRLLDVNINCTFDRPMEVSLEANVTSKSNSYLGPGLLFGITHNNLFGGAEKLRVQANASYEWQTGHNRSSVFNSYEFGVTTSLAFPRLLAPRFIPRNRRDINWTTLSLNASILNRPHYFKLAQFGISYQYDWRSSRNSSMQFTPFKLTYTKLMNPTHEFDSIMAENPAIALSFRDQFVPQLSYTYTLDKFLERARMNGITLTAGLTEAGNLFDVIWRACGVKGEKKLFRTPFSQFIKGQFQFVYRRRLIRGSEQWLVSRAFIGAEHAYGNSSEVPYSEQFYIGGANSIRAFTVRSLGPGSYRVPKSDVDGYFDQTGTFKLELNTEYRFPIVGPLHGAAFIDAGNIWLLKTDPSRPGGKLQRSTFLRDIALGTGVGLRFDIGMIVIRGDLGYGLHAPYSTGRTGYFNIAFKDAFAFHLAIGYPF